MNKHSKTNLENIDCPFPLDFKMVVWEEVQDIMSCDDFKRSILIKTHDSKYLIDVPHILYDSIFKSGENNVIESDLGFDENY